MGHAEAADGGDRITWLGHSTVLIGLDGTHVLTDPVFRRRVGHLLRAEPVDADALGPIDAVLVSHLHYDHLDVPSLRRVARSVPVIVPTGAGRLLLRRGFREVEEVEEGDETTLGTLRIVATHAEHEAGRFGLRAPALGYVVVGTRRVYFAGDTDLFEGMASLAGSLDVALLPVAGWGPRLPRGHLDPGRAAQALRLLEPRVAVPIHWGTYRPLHRRALHTDAPHAFASRARELAPEVAVRILEPGQSLLLEQ